MKIIELILAPFIFIIKQLFLVSYNLTDNYGFAIILLSLAITLLLLPIFILIEKAKKKDDTVKLQMKPLIDEIKRCYKGQERYYYLKTLNRQHNYSPARALIPILSLLLQIPFFIAAYQFLEHFEPLAGVSFGFISDLSAPDALFGKINILPIAMTLVNLLTAYFYTRHGNTAERKQMLVVAGIFLILLFKLPAGLVLYWTMNNVFSFFRLFITNREVFRKTKKTNRQIPFSFSNFNLKLKPLIPKLKRAFIVLTVLGVFSQLNWAINNNFDDIFIRLFGAVLGSVVIIIFSASVVLILNKYKSNIQKLEVQPKIFYALLFLTIYFYLAAKLYFTGVNTSLLFITTIFLIPLQLIGVIYIARNAKLFKPFILHTTFFILMLTFLFQVFNTIVYLSQNEILLNLGNANIKVANSSLVNIILPGIIFSFLSIPFYLKQHVLHLPPNKNTNWSVYLLAVLYITGLIFLWNPLLVFSSSPETFDFAAIEIFKENTSIFVICFVCSILLFAILPKQFKRIWTFIGLLLVTIIFINSSIIPLNLGSLQESRFAEQGKLAAPIFYYLFESVLLILLFYAIKWVYKRNYNFGLIFCLLILNIFLISSSIIKTYKTGFFFSSNKYFENELSYDTNIIPLSKTKQNVIFFLADGFQGWFIKQIMEDNKALQNTYDGFTWFPNTISESNYTHSSIPSILCGDEHSVPNMNNATGYTIKEKITFACEQFIKNAQLKGYKYSSTDMHYANIDKNQFYSFVPKWEENWTNQFPDLKLNITTDFWYSRLYENAIFYSVPLFIKPKIYNNKEWLTYSKQEKPKKVSLKHYNFIRLLPFLSGAESENLSFIYIHEKSLHNPWNIVTDKGELIKDVSPYENSEWFIKQFGKWLKWMKDNDVYDNTKIVIVSDHGATWSQYDGKIDFESPLKWDEENPKKISEEYFWRLNALL